MLQHSLYTQLNNHPTLWIGWEWPNIGVPSLFLAISDSYVTSNMKFLECKKKCNFLCLTLKLGLEVAKLHRKPQVDVKHIERTLEHYLGHFTLQNPKFPY